MLNERWRRLGVLSSTCQHVATLQFDGCAEKDSQLFRLFHVCSICRGSTNGHVEYCCWTKISYTHNQQLTYLIINNCASPRPAKEKVTRSTELSRPVLPFCPFSLHTLICLNSPELHCWLSSHPHCIKMLGFCFRVYVRRSQGAGTDPAKDSMPRACRRSGLPNDRLCLHLVVIDCMFVVGKVFGTALPKTACPGHAVVS